LPITSKKAAQRHAPRRDQRHGDAGTSGIPEIAAIASGPRALMLAPVAITSRAAPGMSMNEVITS
jgi:hypothetical protein